jgi:hypothetical protein
MSKELEGADELTISMLADLRSRIEATGDQVKIIRASGNFRGVIVAAHESALVFWDEENRRLVWMYRTQVFSREWPSLVALKLLGQPPEFEQGSEWRFELYDGQYVGECRHSPWLNNCMSPRAQRFAERYNAGPPTPSPKLKKAKKSDDDEGNFVHALRPRIEEFAP